ncbi:MAG: DNA (cytosine-5-)-methyltransferase [Candidatus Aenigmarchaeota archaeon]|nr:DNA (cytosine-5-)-methyltransferase [Candidatus Aenigmarchaeota archaeon]
MLNGLGLFAGVGGIELGLERSGASRPVCFVEKNKYCQDVLSKRFPEVPIWDDVKTFDGKYWKGKIDIISGGFPCQDISGSGKGEGIKEGTRSGLWFQYKRIIGEIQPLFALIENVRDITIRGLNIVLADLASIGYSSEWFVLSASDMGAPHLRKRCFILAYPSLMRSGRWNSEKRGIQRRNLEQEKQTRGSVWNKVKRCCGLCAEELSDSHEINDDGCRHGASKVRGGESFPSILSGSESKIRWTVEPGVGRVADGVPSRVDRLKCLGNAVVPQCAEYIGRLIMEAIGNGKNQR